jgi:hypothetical protein
VAMLTALLTVLPVEGQPVTFTGRAKSTR